MCRLINAMNGKRPPQQMATSTHVLTACSTGHNSLPRPREARGGGGLNTSGHEQGKRGGGGAAGGERHPTGLTKSNKTIDGAGLDGRGWVQYEAIV
jgi:hypothetical protein